MSKFTARPAAIGYLYQIRFALLLLLNSNTDNKLSVERFDDISFERNGDPVEIIQTKHHAKKGSLSNSSTDLWGTVGNWAELVLNKSLEVTKTKLIIITTNNSISGSAAEQD